MQPDQLTGKDVELIVVGVLCLVLAGSTAVSSKVNLVAISLFIFLAAVSFGLVWLNVMQRMDWPTPWE